MGKIIRNGIEYGGTYDSATSVNYDNSVSGLNARTVQEGIDELGNNLTASDNLKFRFSTDGEGNYGYLGADDSFIPFKSDYSKWKLDMIHGWTTTETTNKDYEIVFVYNSQESIKPTINGVLMQTFYDYGTVHIYYAFNVKENSVINTNNSNCPAVISGFYIE